MKPEDAITRFVSAVILTSTFFSFPAAAVVRVPASTAYFDPDPDGGHIGSSGVIERWKTPENRILWFGLFRQTGEVHAALALRVFHGTAVPLRLTIAGQSRDAMALGEGTNTLRVPFGSYVISSNGYYCIRLESPSERAGPGIVVESLELDGPALQRSHFNLKPRRNAASVHLWYPVPKETEVEAFYCEVTPLEDPVATFYMACGWHRGYFGMQVNSCTERRIIFSVWDSGGEPVDRSKVADADRVKLVAKGEGVYAGDFGHEGTGGHSHLKYMWRSGVPHRFVVTALPTGSNETIYSGFYFHPDQAQWILISSWRAPKDGGYLRGLHSFSENFSGTTGHLVRKARYGNQWIRTSRGEWIELATARFTHDETGRSDRLDRFAGVEQGQFFLCHGGFLPGFTEYGQVFTRSPARHPPADLTLPPVKP